MSSKESMKMSTNLGDTAIINTRNFGASSLYDGTVEMINHRGINVRTHFGCLFIKWHNVLEIRKQEAAE